VLEEILWETAEDSNPPAEKETGEMNKKYIFEIFLITLQSHSSPYWKKTGNVHTKRNV
jgi:hypothetical protein